ncbi:hypothetical protein ACFWUW_30860 [Streptomyces sp. NPDC058655]|uniref:hypothetical protein n=1 Tax=Streptomyces sp. NPDC058655 TaxID=3346577 RepID=UPI003667EA53
MSEQDKRQQPGRSSEGPEKTGTQRQPSAGRAPGRPQQPEKASRGLDEETKRRREEDLVSEGDVEGDEL